MSSSPEDGGGDPTVENPATCSLLGPIGLLVQGTMGVIVILSLVVKRQLEKNKRPWRIWLLDVAKQLAGQAVIHGLNLLISDQVALAVHNNPCSLYFLNILIDTTVGVVIFYFALKGWTWVFAKKYGLEGYESGHYGTPPQASYWFKQLVPYILSIIVMKLLVLLPLTLPRISDWLLRLAHSIIGYFSPSVQIVFVMALFPLIMNVLQFCIVDQVIKANTPEQSVHRNQDHEQGYRQVTMDIGEEVDHPSSDDEGHRRSKDASVQSIASDRRSPLLPVQNGKSPSQWVHHSDYGSTGTSPTPSSAGSASGSTWVRMARRRPSAEDEDGESTTDGSGTQKEGSNRAEEDVDVPRQRRYSRSDAPSPDSAIGRMNASPIAMSTLDQGLDPSQASSRPSKTKDDD